MILSAFFCNSLLYKLNSCWLLCGLFFSPNLWHLIQKRRKFFIFGTTIYWRLHIIAINSSVLSLFFFFWLIIFYCTNCYLFCFFVFFFFFVFKLLFCKFTVLTYKVIKEGFYLKTQREGLITTILSTWLIRWRCLRSVSVQSMLADWLRFFFGRQFHDEWWLTDSLMFYVYSNVTKLYILKLSSPSLTVSETEILYEAMLESSFIC